MEGADLLNKFFIDKKWEIVKQFSIPGKEGEYSSYDDLELSKYSLKLLKLFNKGLYKHQKIAIENFLSGYNIGISTSTASGKTLIFQVCAIETLNHNPKSNILAVYPLKALSNEQENRWRLALEDSGLPSSTVGRIDGGVTMSERQEILANNHVLVMTPDIIHAWLLSNVSSRHILQFIRNIKLIIIDEAHIYSGVFGTNAAYLFRRLQHLILKLGGDTKFIGASATMKDPNIHLENLTGKKFWIIDSTFESSPKKTVNLFFVKIPTSTDVLSSLSELMRYIVNQTIHKFIMFVDSRKQAEYLGSITSRKVDKDEDDAEYFNKDFLNELQISPYRAGYEEVDRELIQNRLTRGSLRGVVSTSALELGIDIPLLTLGMLHGIPSSATSLYQRIGRIGRHQEGIIIIINNGSVNSEVIFRNPDKIFHMPLTESTLYFGNNRIQYIHALCLCRNGGEDDIVNSMLKIEDEKFNTNADFPLEFIDLCKAEKIGEIPIEFQAMKAQAGEDPNHVYPLRDNDVQFKVVFKRGPDMRNLGTLSYSQVMREAYPGAVYYYQTHAFRVYRLDMVNKIIEVRQEKKYTTKPTFLPSLIFPNLSEGNIIQGKRYRDLLILECNLQVRESIIGFSEARGRNEVQIQYPLEAGLGYFFDLPRFTRNYFTTGVIINHPKLNRRDVRCSLLSEILFESYLITIPFERRDINFGTDKHRAEREWFKEGDRFISIYDQTYGSLRLTSHLMENNVLNDVLDKSIEIALNDETIIVTEAELKVLNDLKEALQHDCEPITVEIELEPLEHNRIKVIMPNSTGINVKQDNEEFFVEAVYFHPRIGSLVYRGKHLSQNSKKWVEGIGNSKAPEVIVPISHIEKIPGESKMGLYNYETGEIEEE